MPTVFMCSCWGLLGKKCPSCKGSQRAEEQQLAPHFKLSEMIVTSHKTVPNVPTAEDIDRLKRLAVTLLEPARRDLGALRVNSAFRSQALDQVVAPGFKGLSAHSIGAAADITSASTRPTSLQAIMNWFYDRRAQLKYDQIILEGGCVHVAVLSPYPVGNTNVQRGHSLVRVIKEGTKTFAYEVYDPKSGSQLTRVR